MISLLIEYLADTAVNVFKIKLSKFVAVFEWNDLFFLIFDKEGTVLSNVVKCDIVVDNEISDP
jgi:hypothetical protein